jgi:hypothetical protein
MITSDELGNQIVIDLNTGMEDGVPEELKAKALQAMETIRIPRRPAWDGKRSAEDQKLLENVRGQ